MKFKIWEDLKDGVCVCGKVYTRRTLVRYLSDGTFDRILHTIGYPEMSCHCTSCFEVDGELVAWGEHGQ